MDSRRHPSLGISAIAVHQPAWELENAWFGETMPRKFAHHTGIEARGISLDDELAMGMQAVRQLQRETGCNLADCRGIAFVSPSFIPPSVARRHLAADDVIRERPSHAADELARLLGMQRCRTVGLNWFCCGYSRAFSVVSRRWAPRLALRSDEFVLVVVATRISRITDFACGQTAGLFGDMASATLVAPATSRRYPVHFEILHANAEKQATERPAFDFHVQQHVAGDVGGERGARAAGGAAFELSDAFGGWREPFRTSSPRPQRPPKRASPTCVRCAPLRPRAGRHGTTRRSSTRASRSRRRAST
jgi:3-oxoacyl-[acyl-carrier-protein] synthase III